MSIDAFLQFWSHYNTLIIEVLIGLILLLLVYLAFRSFFGSHEEKLSEKSENSSRTVDIERKAPNKQQDEAQEVIADDQNRASKPATQGESEAFAAEKKSLLTEIETLKVKVVESEQKLSDSQKELQNFKEQGAVSSAAQSASGDQDERIKTLEARLAEYEIIAEDIADLSYYKEENAKLQATIDGLRGGGAAEPATETPVVATEPTTETPKEVPEDTPKGIPAEPSTESAISPVTTQAPAAEAPIAEAPSAEAPATQVEIAPTPEPSGSPTPTESIQPLPDPDLENETDIVEPKEKKSSSAPQEDETDLMDKFQNFVKKG